MKLILSNKLEKLLNADGLPKVKRSESNKLDTTLFDKISKKGLLEKTTYSLPLNDTLGQRFFNATQFVVK
jgi:hypothetical protein